MAPKTITLWKKRGETPLQALDRLRSELVAERGDFYKTVPLSYAGRLDPMAEGALLVLIGEENKKRKEYLGLDKTYEVEIVFGVETDTADTLGLVKKIEKGQLKKLQNLDKESLKKVLANFVGTYEQVYPAFSSRPFEGKPLFQWAHEGIFPKVKKRVTIHSIELVACGGLLFEDFKKKVEEDFDLMQEVVGDFRQEKVIAGWRDFFQTSQDLFQVVILVECASGAYMRQLSQDVGERLGVSAIARRIVRQKIGNLSSL
ncbi:MAG: hypothetical protein PHF79_00790 [Candidatus Pacebacteria bacterium]|nr:hypothetical protein [Candidatus Paceibacterota bacterium]